MRNLRVFLLSVMLHVILMLLLACIPSGGTTSPLETSQSLKQVPQTPKSSIPSGESESLELSNQQINTLNSLELVDEYPLYSMHFFGDHENKALSNIQVSPQEHIETPSPNQTWACSLFAVLGSTSEKLFGRNFDWEYSTALLLNTSPSDGYASVSMVDITYLGFKR